MTIKCDINQLRGSVTILGSDIPDGTVTLVRNTPGEKPYLLRNGAFALSTKAFVREDSEAPFGVPLRYDLDVIPTNRILQYNLALTPDFTHGLQGWAAGTGRTASTVVDTETSRTVGHFTAGSGATTAVSPPTMIGHANSALPTGLTASSYTITLPTTGAGAVATNDQLVLVHSQLPVAGVYTSPAVPSPFTKLYESPTITDSAGGSLVDLYPSDNLYPSDGLYPSDELYLSAEAKGLVVSVWRATRLAGAANTVTVTFPAGSGGIGTLMWIRGVSATLAPAVGELDRSTLNMNTAPGMTISRPALVIGAFAGLQGVTATPPGASSVTGGASFLWSIAANSSATVLTNRNITITGGTVPDAGVVPPVSLYYGLNAKLLAGVGIQIAFMVDQSLVNRTIATGKAAVLTAGVKYLLTGRFKFTTPDLWLWQDVKDQGTWQHLTDTKASWNAVRSSAVTVSTNYLRLFASIWDPTAGTDYIAPVQLISVGTPAVNTWTDFSFYFTPAVDIPTTAQIRLLHGSNIREAAVTWMFDQIGITAVSDRQTVYWFSGDSNPPSSPEDYYFAQDDWIDRSRDSSMSWSGTAGNSVSVFTGPSKIGFFTVCYIEADVPSPYVCDPVHLSDPISPQRSLWSSLLRIEPLTHAARQTLHQIIDRPDKIAVSQTRNWPSGTLTVKTDTWQERLVALSLFETGRIIYLRNPDPNYPENNWYLAIGDVTETRTFPDHRRHGRTWTIPFTRVARPSGLIESSSAQTWAEVMTDTWDTVRQQNANWLDVLTRA